MYHYQRLRDLREDKDLLQRDVAQLLDTSERQYSRWETGFSEIPAHHLVTLADYYATSVDYIIGRTNSK